MPLFNWISSKNEKWTLKRILIVFTSSIVVVMTLLLISAIQANSSFYNQWNQDLNRLVDLQSKTEQLEMTYNALRSYTLSGDLQYLNDYKKEKTKLILFFSQYTKKNKQSQSYALYYDAHNMFETFVEEADKSIRLFDEGAQAVYVNHQVLQFSKNKNFLKVQLEKIISVELVEIKSKYGDIEASTRNREAFIYFIVFIIITLTLIANNYIANLLATPIHILSVHLKKIADGDYDREPVEQVGVGEIRNMMNRFNKMKVKLADNIDIMNENSRIRDQLKSQEIELLESDIHLKQSKLDFLQSQINPHFLFNTLNSIQTLADIEEAPQTEKMLFHMSSLIRYNLKKMNHIVPLSEELDIVESYIYIQIIRFGNRIQYAIEKDEAALMVLVPSMILQPLVENAMIHGLEPKIGQGQLTIRISKEMGHVVISVYDNGIGMDQETIDKLMSAGETEQTNPEIKDHTSIGVTNVIKRCMLYYGKNIVSIRSEKGQYTEFRLEIPERRASHEC
ncbi:MAG: sensor histidine kinase [Vallitaleaceae bacterium]|nr:sensor histidine kinase [Vallitaleaceae bacterium]